MPDIAVVDLDAEAVRPVRHKILRPHQTIEDCVFPGDDAPDTLHVGALDSRNLAAVASIFRDPLPDDPRDTDWRVRGMATLPEFRGRGLGGRLLETCIRHAAGRGGGRVWCNARSNATAFYARHEFVMWGPEFDIPGIGPHYVMVRTL